MWYHGFRDTTFFMLPPGQTYTMTFSSNNRSIYAEDNMICVTVPGTITRVNNVSVSEFSVLYSPIYPQVYLNHLDEYALTYLDGNSLTFSAGGGVYRYFDENDEIQEIKG